MNVLRGILLRMEKKGWEHPGPVALSPGRKPKSFGLLRAHPLLTLEGLEALKEAGAQGMRRRGAPPPSQGLKLLQGQGTANPDVSIPLSCELLQGTSLFPSSVLAVASGGLPLLELQGKGAAN